MVTILAGSLRAQCPQTNSAFSAGEELNYQLYFNWKFIWIKAGTATLSTQLTNYDGERAYRCDLLTRGSKRTDKFFVMRDTLSSIVTPELVPLYYHKGALEGKRHYIDDVWYSYPGNGTVALRQSYRNSKGVMRQHQATSTECVYDMMSMLLHARSFDVTAFHEGQHITFPMADGDDVKPTTLVYRGRQTCHIAEMGTTYRCLVFSFVEPEGKKEKEIATFFVTDDLNHIPVRLDLFLTFGTAKAFLRSFSNLRNPQTSIVEGK